MKGTVICCRLFLGRNATCTSHNSLVGERFWNSRFRNGMKNQIQYDQKNRTNPQKIRKQRKAEKIEDWEIPKTFRTISSHIELTFLAKKLSLRLWEFI